MTASSADAAQIPSLKFGIGQPVSRKEDPRLLTGRGRYTDDMNLPGQAYAAVLRAQEPHGLIKTIDHTAARALPGVLAVLTAEDMVGYGTRGCALPLKSHDGSPLPDVRNPVLATGRVRHVGEALAVVVAETEAIAFDAVDLIVPGIDSLPAVTDAEAALATDAPQLYDDHSNLCLDWRYGDFEAADKAFETAAHVTRLRLENQRVVVASLEPRAAIASFEESESASGDGGKYVLRAGCQGVFGLRRQLAQLLEVEPEQVQVLAEDIGGSFGMKSWVYAEYVPMLHAARALGRPVKWRSPRSESFVSDHQGRATVIEAALALDADGHFLAVKVDSVSDMGAYMTFFGPAMASVNMQKNLPSLYRTPTIAITCRCAVTNSLPIGPYRGAGRPEGNFVMERLIDQAARETGHDPVELRRRNLIPKPALPFTAASGLAYDSGDFEAVFESALDRADWHGFPARRAQSEAQGRLRGRGLCSYLEVTAPANPEMGGIHFTTDGRVRLITGTLDYGQGHASAFAQVLVERLGVPFELIDLIQGDSDQLLAGGGTGGSRSIMASSKAIVEAADRVIEKGKVLAAHALEAAVTDIEFVAGRFRIVGTDRAIDLMTLAAGDPPPDLADGLDTELVAEGPPSAFPNGCHVAEVEIDPETGSISLLRWAAIDDFGTLINPMLVEGQVHGGLAQGIGQALMEHAIYDESGQLLTGTFMDYALPRADTVPFFDVGFLEVPATSNPLGVKGCGEAGVSAALPAVMNAIADALASAGAAPVDMPATPERIWRALSAVKNSRAA